MSQYKLESHPIDQIRNLKVVVIGAGISGILAGILLPIKVPGIELKIIEKNLEAGGVWVENTFPGVRCDTPANVYQSTFAPRTQWSEEYAQGPEIREYWQDLAEKHDLQRFLSLGQQVDRVEWDDGESIWRLTVRNVRTGLLSGERADFVMTAVGRFNAWRMPDYPGMSNYKGVLRHTSNWDPDFDPNGKNVAVIGNGASGVQVVPALAKVVHRLDHYARSKTWIAGTFTGNNERSLEPRRFPAEQLASFKEPKEYLKFRKQFEGKHWRRFAGVFKGSNRNAAMRKDFVQIMAQRLRRKPDLLNIIVPDFSPYCRRLTPAPGYLEALCEENVQLIQQPIKGFTANGIETIDGTVREVDAIFCATGANIDAAPAFSIIARSIDLRTAWKPDGHFGFPYTYMGLGTPGFPNLLFVYGPHTAAHSGTFVHSLENQLTYYAKLLRKVSSQGIKTMEPSFKAADDFVAYSDAYFPTTVVSENCSSWYDGGKPGGRIHGLWPGSAARATIARREPRWEDWQYEYLSPTGNRFGYFGNGWTNKEQDADSDMTSYLKLPENVDLRTVHESWFDA